MNGRPDWLHDLFGAFGPITVRRFFGGHSLYRESVMFGLAASDGEIYLKCDATTEPRFRTAGSHPFAYGRDTKKVTLSYFSLPSEALEDPELAREFADLAFAAALRAAAAKPKRARKSGTAPEPRRKPLAAAKSARRKP